MSHELLLEIGTEEIPAGFLDKALAAMGKLMAKYLDSHALSHGEVRCLATPRRLAVCVQGLPDRQPDVREEVVGPAKRVAFDAMGNYTKAAEGFVRSQGVSVNDLKVMQTPKGEYVYVVKEWRGKETRDLLVKLLPEFILAISFPKSMRWGDGKISFARPVQWLCAVYDGEVIPFGLGDMVSTNITRGHRFLAPASMSVGDYSHYVLSLRQAQVLISSQERREVLLAEITRAAEVVGGKVLPDNELVSIVTNLVEWPFAVCGTFDRRYLALPRSVLITSMREHQKYFAVINGEGALLPFFVAVNNTRVKDHRTTTHGHERVLRARLEDALFFFEQDRRKPLVDLVSELGGVIFQARLGTMYEKTERLKALSVYLAASLAPESKTLVGRAAYLAKADLLTAMVNEFPSLQGVVGREYALLQGEDPVVATALEEHYFPIRAGGPLPSQIQGALVGMADKLDTIVGCFGIGQVPTGTTDPFGLRRLALGVIHIIMEHKLVVSLDAVIDQTVDLYGDKIAAVKETVKGNVLSFLKGRFVNDQISRGLPADVVDAVVSVSFDDVVDVSHRIEALCRIRKEPTFILLAVVFKRVMNITKGCSKIPIDLAFLIDPIEKNLYDTFLSVQAEIEPFLEHRDYWRALLTILKMKESIDLFFDKVLVMNEDKSLQTNRLALLTQIVGLFMRVADFSKIQAGVKE